MFCRVTMSFQTLDCMSQLAPPHVFCVSGSGTPSSAIFRFGEPPKKITKQIPKEKAAADLKAKYLVTRLQLVCLLHVAVWEQRNQVCDCKK